MTFFEHQARARKRSTVLVLLFVAAVVGVTLAVNLVAAGAYSWAAGHRLLRLDAAGTLVLDHAAVPAALYGWTTLAILALILGRSLFAVGRLRAGGDVVAAMVAGRVVDPDTRDRDERRLLNVVDEMAIASGVTVPRVFVLPGEAGINAFAAGYAPNQAALVVTEGALRQLRRDELQGVIAHEFSHVLNGDMRLNVHMIGVLAGILFVGEIGGYLLRARRGSRDRSGSAMLALGVGLLAIGYVGLFFGRLIKAAVSRQREFLADASAVQFTRNPEGIAGALAMIGGLGAGSLVRHRRAETLSHMFFAEGVALWFRRIFATHPPIPERIHRIHPRFLTEPYLAIRARLGAEPSVRPAVAPRAGATPPPPPTRRAVAAVLTSVGSPARRHVDYAARLVEALPVAVREAIGTAPGAQAVVLAFALGDDEFTRKRQRWLLALDGADALGEDAERLAGVVRTLPPAWRLPVVALALPALGALDAAGREGFVLRLERLVNADQRVTLAEFVLLTLVRQHLHPHAGRPVPVRFRSIVAVADEARLVLSLLAHAGDAPTDPAYARGLGVLGLAVEPPVPPDAIVFPRVAEALDRLRLLAPFVKQLLLAACVETVMTDERIGLAEAELLRAVAASLDCPVPPILESLDATAPAAPEREPSA